MKKATIYSFVTFIVLLSDQRIFIDLYDEL